MSKPSDGETIRPRDFYSALCGIFGTMWCVILLSGLNPSATETRLYRVFLAVIVAGLTLFYSWKFRRASR